MTTKPITIWIAGSTERTALIAQTLFADARFSLQGVLTPSAKPIGRKQIMTANPLDAFASEHQIVRRYVTTNRIDQSIKSELIATQQPDILLVVDFGYFVPKWLLEWPLIAPLNIHPSTLPRWRGSSPGQFVLLYGETESSVTLMKMNEGLDTGPIISQLPLVVDQGWNSDQYYAAAFSLMADHLGDLILDFINHPERITTQPVDSPTATALRLNREDGFIGWQLLLPLLTGVADPTEASFGDLSPLLIEAQSEIGNLYALIPNACRALSPWPGLWTLAPTASGEKRLKLLDIRQSKTGNKLDLCLGQLDGGSPATLQQLAHKIPQLGKI